MQDIFLISFGALLGANTRFIIIKKFEELNFRNEFSILIINTIASFLLGFFLAVLPQISSLDLYYQLVLFCSIGFLGSLSTFSTFVYDLFDLLLRFNFLRVFKLFFTSLALGVIALAFGFLLAN